MTFTILTFTIYHFEGIDETLYSGLVEIGIIAVQLNSVLTATRVMDSYVPVTSYSMPSGVLMNQDQFVILDFFYDLSGSVGGVIVHDDDVERVGGTHFLFQRAMNRVCYRARAVLTRYNDRGGDRV